MLTTPRRLKPSQEPERRSQERRRSRRQSTLSMLSTGAHHAACLRFRLRPATVKARCWVLRVGRPRRPRSRLLRCGRRIAPHFAKRAEHVDRSSLGECDGGYDGLYQRLWAATTPQHRHTHRPRHRFPPSSLPLSSFHLAVGHPRRHWHGHHFAVMRTTTATFPPPVSSVALPRSSFPAMTLDAVSRPRYRGL